MSGQVTHSSSSRSFPPPPVALVPSTCCGLIQVVSVVFHVMRPSFGAMKDACRRGPVMSVLGTTFSHTLLVLTHPSGTSCPCSPADPQSTQVTSSCMPGAGQLACWGRGSWTWCKDVGGRGPRPVVGCAACAACACGPHPQHIPAHTPLPNAYTKRTIKAPRRMHAYAIHARLK